MRSVLRRNVTFTSVCTALSIAAFATLSPSTLSAQENVILQQKGGGLTISGKLVGSDSTSFVVESPDFGRITVDKARFICVGRDCPSGAEAAPLVASTGSATSQIGPDFGVYGSNTVGGQLMPAMVEGYATSLGGSSRLILGSEPEQSKIDILDPSNQKLARIDLKAKGSGTSFPALLDGSASIGMSSRPAKDKEAASLIEGGLGDVRDAGKEHVIALDGLIIIVSPDNPIKLLSIDQVAAIYSGEITDWSELGGKPGPITAYTRPPRSGTFDTFISLVMKPFGRKLASNVVELEANVEISDSVARDSSAIAYVPFAFERNARAVSIATACGITSQASVFDVKTEEYPLARRLFLYTTNRALPNHAKGLLDYSLSPAARQHVNEVGFIDLSPSRRPFAQQALRLAAALNVPAEDFSADLMREFVADFGNFDRLSFTFRFRSGSTELENLSLQKLSDFARELTSGSLSNQRIRLVGFADSIGGFENNRVLSAARAESVKSALLSAGAGRIDPARIEVRGYSELMPVACNTDASGREKNRRVEVWVDAG
ncbi:MAG: phosphate ABC transporter substrate-binding/OmpA family protein [Pseudomonadota bacterium]